MTPFEFAKDGLVRMAATGFGFGYSPVMPGTVGTLWGLPLAVLLSRVPSVAGQAVIALGLTLAAIPLCGAAEKRIGGKDPACIVADEFLTLPICFIGLPLNLPVLITGFVLHRIFDITKPPPIRQLQHLPGGTGIVVDDFLAALAALAGNHLLWQMVFR
jgi:phosphatidylglycerophosphatase A